MSQHINIQEGSQSSFIKFLFQNQKNRKLLGIAIVGTIFQFAIFKSLYPFADFFSDSYSYIFAASANLDINIWPIGYSKFLRAFHELTHSDTAVVAFQYFFLEVSSLYFFFTLIYFYKPGKSTQNILFIFLFFNPLFLYISNYINSDPLFAALSLVWITELFWIIHRPRHYHIFTQGILLFLAFTVRNNAYYYPFVAAVAFLLSKQPARLKLAGIIFPLLLILPFVIHSRNEAYKLTGTKQFSLFTGWQLANNALYMYGHLQVDSNQLATVETRELNNYSRQFYNKVPVDFTDYLSEYVANFFIRQPESPLKQYFKRNYHPKDEYEIVVDWGKASVVYGDYGAWLIKRYPVQFAKFFMLLNTKNYFFPPLEKLEVYNLGQDDVEPLAQDWFDFKAPSISAISKTAQGKILFLFPYIFFFLNALYVGSIVWLILKRKTIRPDWKFKPALFLTGIMIVANFIFCVFATIIVLRYQFFPMIVMLTVPLLLIEVIETSGTRDKIREIPVLNNNTNFELSEV